MQARLKELQDNIHRVIYGKPHVVRLAVGALLARGHILIEDAPGLGKTMLARAIAQSIDAEFKRIQFTPDMLPTDVCGVSVYHPRRESFDFVPGPVFCEVLLADEINRTSPRTQASLLEAMEERQVTVEGQTRPLQELFFVVATQNPIDLEGTFPLPEAQLDRFLMRLELGYPDPATECQILASQVESHPVDDLTSVLSSSEIVEMQRQVRKVHVSPEVQQYIVQIITGTREHNEVRLGASPRGSLSLMRAAQALSFMDEETFVTPDTVQEAAKAVLAHRIILEPHRAYAGTPRTEIVQAVLQDTPVPIGSVTSARARARSSPSSRESGPSR